MRIESSEAKATLQGRLRRIEGQTRGIQKMLEEERDCREILQQLNAVHAAVERVTDEFVRVYAKDCLLRSSAMAPGDLEAMVDDLLSFMARAR